MRRDVLLENDRRSTTIMSEVRVRLPVRRERERESERERERESEPC